MKIKRDIIFVGSLVPEADALDIEFLSQAANLYQTKFIDFIKPDIIISILPIFYKIKRRFVFRENIVFVNNQSGLKNKLNYFYRFFTDTFEAITHIKENKIPNVFFYNIDYQNFLIILFSKFILRRKVYIIIADYDNYKHGLINNIFNTFLKKADGLIVLNSNIKCNKNTQLVLGLLYLKDLVFKAGMVLNNKVFLSGSLGQTTGFELALEFFSQNPDYELYITGKSFRYDTDTFNGLIDSYTKKFPNIHYKGFLEYKDYIALLDDCDIALSLRNPSDEEHNYNFPSKILEYFSKSKLVISTMQYNDVPPDLIFYSEFNCSSLKQTLNKIYGQTPDEIKSRKQNIYSFVKENFTEAKVTRVINDLMDTYD